MISEGKTQIEGEDADDMQIDDVTEELKKSTLSLDVEAASIKKALDSEKLSQGNVEGEEAMKESKSSTLADEILVDTEKLDEVVNKISTDVFPDSTLPI